MECVWPRITKNRILSQQIVFFFRVVFVPFCSLKENVLSSVRMFNGPKGLNFRHRNEKLSLWRLEWMNPNKSGCMRKSWENFSRICRVAHDVRSKDEFPTIRPSHRMRSWEMLARAIVVVYLLSDRLHRCRQWFIINRTFSIFGYWMSTWPNERTGWMNEWLNWSNRRHGNPTKKTEKL